MKILITGGFGFIGGRLAKFLSDAGHQISLGTRKDCAPPDWLPQSAVLNINWSDLKKMANACSTHDVIIHAAGINSQDCLNDPRSALEFNGGATERLVSSAMMAGVKQFIYLSTAHVYGSPLQGAINENTIPCNSHPYATSHLAGEKSVLNANKIRGIVLRLSNVFGSPVDKNVNCWHLLINDLCRQAIEKRTLTIRSAGLQQRDFIAMSRVCQDVKGLIDNPAEIAMGQIFNMGSGVSQSVISMTQLIQKRCIHVLGYRPDIISETHHINENPSKLTYKSVYSLYCTEVSGNNRNRDIVEIDQLLNFCRNNFEYF